MTRKDSKLSWGRAKNVFVLSLLVAGLMVLPSTLAFPQATEMDAEPQLTLWKGVDGQPLPFHSHEEVKDFLKTAEVVELEDIPTGVTHPRKATLEKDGIRMHAVYRDVDVYKQRWDDPKHGPRMDFRDNCIYECAAYELSVLLGMDIVPPTVPRELEDKKGTLQVWIEGAMTEADRAAGNVKPPLRWRWMMQQQVMALFDQLIFNDDRNQGNMLIDKDWKVWLIDHTRAFRTFSKPSNPQLVRYCEKNMLENLKKLEKAEVEEKLGTYLSQKEREALLKRRDVLVKHIDKLIKDKGEKDVVFIFRTT